MEIGDLTLHLNESSSLTKDIRDQNAESEREKSVSQTTESSSLESEIFEVEEIIAHKKLKGQDLWRIRWAGYGPQKDTWEPRENLVGEKTQQMLAEFEAKEATTLERRKNLRQKSLEYKKQRSKRAGSRISSTSESGDELDESSNKEGWFGIKPTEGTREQRKLFVADRRLSKTEKLLSEISSPGVRVLRNHLREKSVSVEKSVLSSPAITPRKRGRPPKKTPRKKIIEEDVFTSESSPAKIKEDRKDEYDTKREEVFEKSTQRESSETHFCAESLDIGVGGTDTREKVKNEEKEKLKEKMSVPMEKSMTTNDLGISRKLKTAYASKSKGKTPQKERESTRDAKETVEKIKSTIKEEGKRKQQGTTQKANLQLKVLPENASIKNNLEKLFQKKKQNENEREIPYQMFEEIVMDGKVERAREILSTNSEKYKMDLNRTDETGKTLLHKLCEIKCPVSHTQCELIELLVTNGAKMDIREENNQQIPLHIAILNRRLCHVRKLISLRSLINLTDRNGKTPLMLALECSDLDFLKLLLKAGASFQLVLEKIYRDKDRYKRAQRIVLDHECRLRRALNSARDNVTINMSVKCISPIFVNPVYEDEVNHIFNLSTLPQFPGSAYSYMLFFSVAEFIGTDDKDKDLCNSVDAKMWGRCPIISVTLNEKECTPLKTENKFAFFCTPSRDQNRINIKMNKLMYDTELMLISQMVLTEFHVQPMLARPVAPVHPIPNSHSNARR